MALGTAVPTRQSGRGAAGRGTAGAGLRTSPKFPGPRAPRMRATSPPPGAAGCPAGASRGEGAERPVGAAATGAVRPDARAGAFRVCRQGWFGRGKQHAVCRRGGSRPPGGIARSDAAAAGHGVLTEPAAGGGRRARNRPGPRGRGRAEAAQGSPAGRWAPLPVSAFVREAVASRARLRLWFSAR